MLFVGAVLGHTNVERIGLVDIHPNRRSPFLPLRNREILWHLFNWLCVVTRFSEHENVIRNSHARSRAVFLELLVKQAQSFGASHLDYRVTPDTHSRVKNPSFGLMNANDVAGKILEADYSILPF